MEPTNNHTALNALDCTFGETLDISPHQIMTLLVADRRDARAHVWRRYQELKATLPNNQQLTTRSILYELAGRHVPDWDDIWTMKDFIELDGREWDATLSSERWSRYRIESRGRETPNAANRTLTCRVGEAQEVTAENATVSTPVRGQMLVGTSTLPLANMEVIDLQDGKDDKFTLFRGQHLMLTLAREDNCRDIRTCSLGIFCTVRPSCNQRYKVSRMNSIPVLDGAALPTPFQNASTAATFAYISVRLGRSDGVVPVTVISSSYSYGYLEMMASLLSAFSILLLAYKAIMGDFRVNPLGWMQKYVLYNSTKQLMQRVKDQKDNEWLENVLFTFYINGNGLYSEQDSVFKTTLAKLKRRWSDAGLPTSTPP
jgi:hypothetical protein